MVGEWAVRIVAYGIAKEMCVASAVREIVFAIQLMHPGGLEEAVRVLGFQGLAVLAKNHDRTRFLSELQHVVCHACHTRGQRVLVAFRKQGRAERSLLSNRSGRLELIVAIPLQLPSPDAAKVDINLSVIVLEHAWVDAVAASNGIWLRNEWSLRTVCNCHAQMKDSIVVFG